MAISSNRMSTYTQISTFSDHEPSKISDSTKDMWSSMLDSVASGKRLPEKNILVLGGSLDAQREFLEAVSSDSSVKRAQDRHGSRHPALANNFALSYTYYDVLDADHEDILARLSLYFLADPSVSFTPLLRPLLTPQTIPNTLVVILLDWTQPWLWIRQLRDWVRLLRNLLISLDERCKQKMEEVMNNWRDRGQGTTSLDIGGSNAAAEGSIALPLGPGEWGEALGLPLCVVCQNSDQMEKLERERAWKEEEFDFVQQFLRTILLKHGASLIYTIPSVPSPLQTLIHSSLGVQSLIKKQPLKHNVIDRDKVVLPSNWDSWGKIRVLHEGFDVEGVSQGWSLDIEEPSKPVDIATSGRGGQEGGDEQPSREPVGALVRYEEMIRDSGIDLLSVSSIKGNGQKLDVHSVDPQSFLASQLEALDRIRLGTDPSSTDDKQDSSARKPFHSGVNIGEERNIVEEGRVNEHIGPVQFNVGGIQVDADDILHRSKNRQNHQTSSPETPNVVSPDGNYQHEAVASFFAGLIKRGGSTASIPKPGMS